MSAFSTLLYHSIFDYPLTFDEIHRYLISEKIVSFSKLKEAVKSLLKTGKILSSGEFFIPSSTVCRPSSLVLLRQRRKKISQKKIAIAKRASRIVSIIPWIKMVAITGALAMENSDDSDDIDLMIVCSKNRLWIVRPLVHLLVLFFFKSRKPTTMSNEQKTENNDNALCFNLWVDEYAFEIPKNQRNLYTAHELAQMKPIINKDGIYEKMMAENIWGMKYLANAWKRFEGWQAGRLAGKKPSLSQFFNLLTCKPVNLLNLLAFRLQLWHMKPKMTNERVLLHSAFFHPGNRADTIIKAYDHICHRSFRSAAH